MSRIKRAICDALAAQISAGVPALNGAAFGLWQDEEVEANQWPAVAVLPGKLVLQPWQEDEIDDTDPQTLVLNVGDFEGDVEIRVYAKSADERENVGQLVNDLFFAREGAPGTLVASTAPITLNVQGASPPTTYATPAAATFTLDDETWREEMVFSKKRFDFMTVGVLMPCLIARAVPTITHLQLQLSVEQDLTQPFNPAGADQTVEVNDDGSLTLV